LTLSARLAPPGHRLQCANRSVDRIAELAKERVPAVEERLSELVGELLAAGDCYARAASLGKQTAEVAA
jgi:UDP-glucose 6-dehydrogenase